MISETRERFLRAIVARVPAEEIEEIHFFPPIRQGGVESGVAVIAAGETVATAAAVHFASRREAAIADAGAESASNGTEPHDAYAVRTPPEPPAASAESEPPAAEYPAPGAHDHPPPEPLVPEGASEAEQPAEPPQLREPRAPGGYDHAAPPSMTDDIPTTPVLDDLATGAEPAVDESGERQEEAPHRFTVLTARYRLVLKGIDRGKWDANVVAEADAPLLTVEAVVRGVQRRSGDVDDPERMSGDEIRRELARMDAADAARQASGPRGRAG